MRSTRRRRSERSMAPLDPGAIDPRQIDEVGHELAVDLHPARQFGMGLAEVADQGLDAGIDVGAVEGGHAGFDEGGHVGDRPVAVDVAVAAGQMPAALDDARDLVPGASVMRGTLTRQAPESASR